MLVVPELVQIMSRILQNPFHFSPDLGTERSGVERELLRCRLPCVTRYFQRACEILNDTMLAAGLHRLSAGLDAALLHKNKVIQGKPEIKGP